MSKTADFAHLIARVMEEVREVEAVLEAEVASQVELVTAVGRHTLRAGGKRLRPALAVLSAQATGLPLDLARVRRLAASLEMVHMATLVHDDVIDHSSLRRGLPTAAAVFGNTASILSGDVFLAKSMAVLADDGDLSVIRTVSHAVVDLAQGEVRELEVRGDLDLALDDHYEILRLKTASFLRCCCEVGALVAEAGPATLGALGAFGENLGMAFQIADDLLDYAGDGAKTGKANGTDYREGCATLPLLLALRGTHNREALLGGFGAGEAADVSASLASIEATGAYDEARRIARAFANRAVDALAPLPNSEERDLLAAVCEFTVNREA